MTVIEKRRKPYCKKPTWSAENFLPITNVYRLVYIVSNNPDSNSLEPKLNNSLKDFKEKR